MNDDRKFASKKPGLLKLLKVGLPAFIIEKIINISTATFSNYFRRVKVSGEFKGELLSKKQSSKFLFEVYCKLETNTFKNYDSLSDLSPICREKIQIILKKYFNIDEIVLYLDGVSDTIQYNSTVNIDSKVDENYKNFLLDLYSSELSPKPEIVFWTGERILGNYCRMVVNNSVFLPDNLIDLFDYMALLKKHMVDNILSSSRKYNAPIIGLEVISLVDKTLSDLKEKNKLVLQKYYGLSSFEKMKTKEIAKEFGVSLTSINQKRQQGVWGFKHKFDKSIFDPIDNCLSKIIDLKEKHKKELSDLAEKWGDDFNKMKVFYTGKNSVSNCSNDNVNFLITPLEDLQKDFSVRLYNCLVCEFDRVYEVLNASKTELYKLRKFGKKSFDELEVWVHAKGFELETEFIEEDIIKFEGLIAMEEN